MVIDLTGIATSVLAFALSLVSAIATGLINKHMTDRAAASTLCRAVENSIGVLQQQGSVAAQILAPHITVPGVPDRLAPAVSYVMTHAGDEMERLGVTPERVAQKVLAQVGLAQIAVNTAVAGSPAPVVPDPIGPLVVTTSLGPGRT
jgi:hypothetical protein